MASYEIVLKNCAFFARHGVYTEEEVLGQRFYVDAKLLVKSDASLEDDSIDGTVDYGKAYLAIEKIVKGKRKKLIESLAYEIAKSLCKKFKMVESATVTVRKPNAPVQGVLDGVEVTITFPQ